MSYISYDQNLVHFVCDLLNTTMLGMFYFVEISVNISVHLCIVWLMIIFHRICGNICCKEPTINSKLSMFMCCVLPCPILVPVCKLLPSCIVYSKIKITKTLYFPYCTVQFQSAWGQVKILVQCTNIGATNHGHGDMCYIWWRTTRILWLNNLAMQWLTWL